VLRGARAAEIPLATVDIGVDTVDWRQLRRWGIDERRVPPGTAVLFREPTAFERYWPYIGAAIAIIGAQAVLISLLLMQRRNRRRAEEALRTKEAALRESHTHIQDLAGRLISAQETERARIARELHDDVSQQLAAVAIQISGIKRRDGVRRQIDVLEAMSTLQERTTQVAEGIRRISHDLHPSVLEHVGLVDALRAHCAEIARQHSLRILFVADPTIDRVERDAAFCLFRVAQEALHNVVKHARAQTVHVLLTRYPGLLSLSISDDGEGFDLNAQVLQGRGLGLRSIEERVRLVGGRVTLTSSPNRGTTIAVHVTEPADGRAEARSA
jgi:signal transduction histidine kinase